MAVGSSAVKRVVGVLAVGVVLAAIVFSRSGEAAEPPPGGDRADALVRPVSRSARRAAQELQVRTTPSDYPGAEGPVPPVAPTKVPFAPMGPSPIDSPFPDDCPKTYGVDAVHERWSAQPYNDRMSAVVREDLLGRLTDEGVEYQAAEVECRSNLCRGELTFDGLRELSWAFRLGIPLGAQVAGPYHVDSGLRVVVYAPADESGIQWPH